MTDVCFFSDRLIFVGRTFQTAPPQKIVCGLCLALDFQAPFGTLAHGAYLSSLLAPLVDDGRHCHWEIITFICSILNSAVCCVVAHFVDLRRWSAKR